MLMITLKVLSVQRELPLPVPVSMSIFKGKDCASWTLEARFRDMLQPKAQKTPPFHPSLCPPG